MKPMKADDKLRRYRLRFWAHVDKREDCWLWTGLHTVKGGYGTFYMDGKNRRSHRVAWMLVNGAIPDGMMVCHRCDNPPCVNPNHLFLGTHRDNMIDAGQKKRLGRANALKRHCKFGHPFDQENTRIIQRPKGRLRRLCLACQKARSRARRGL